MRAPVISVLLPVFKADVVYLREAVDSILSQTFSDFELLILYEPADFVGTEEINRYFEVLNDSRVRIITLSEHSGLPRSLNYGLSIANGKYIARMDADDISRINRLDKQYCYMEEHPEVDILGGVIQLMGQDSVPRAEKMFNIIYPANIRPIRMMFENAGLAHPTAFYRKSSFDQTGLRYDETLKGSEDYRLWADAVIKGLIIDSLPDVVLNYRISDEQASIRLSEQMIVWDDETRKKLWMRVSDYTHHEIEVLKSFGKGCRIVFDSNEYKDVFDKMLQGNREKFIYDQDFFKKEITWQWIKYALYQVRKQKRPELLLNTFSLRGLIPSSFVYSIRQAIDIIRGRK